MSWLAQVLAGQSIPWLLLSAVVALVAGFLSSLLTYLVIERRRIAYAVNEEIKKQRTLTVMETDREKQERIRQEVIRWSNPILGAVKELGSRLWNILEDGAYVALNESFKVHSDPYPKWSITYQHWMPSTLFLFGQYFAWVQMLQQQLSFELFQTQQEKDKFKGAIDEVGRSLARWPTNRGPRSYECSGQDTQVFRLQQRSIGELMTIRNEDGGPQCMSYPDFLRKLDGEPEFSQHFAPLRALLEDVKPSDDCRWKRLKATKQALDELQDYCERLLEVPPRGEEEASQQTTGGA